MNSLTVYAHPTPHSFNAAMKEMAVNTLTEAGHAVKVSDLYKMRFKATLDEHDFKDRQEQDFFNPLLEQYHAAVSGTFADDIAQEVEKLKWADVIIFQFPLWWLSFPAILKGWCDRVIANGIAVNFQTYEPLLVGKRALCSLTTGGREENYTPEGPTDINALLTFARVTFSTAGIEFLPPFVAYGVPTLTDDERKELLKRYSERLLSL